MMEIDPKLKEAAVAAVCSEGSIDGPVLLEEYPGMLVAKIDETSVLPLHVFVCDNGERYVIGTVKTT